MFLCAHNTDPGWLTRSPPVDALPGGGAAGRWVATAERIGAAARRLELFTGSAADPLPQGRVLGDLPQRLEAIPAAEPPRLEGEFSAAHQPLDVGAPHWLCHARDLTAIGSATLPDLFPARLDLERRALVMGAVDPAMGELLPGLAINQTFRRDFFACGASPPAPARRRGDLAASTLMLKADAVAQLVAVGIGLAGGSVMGHEGRR